MTHPTDVRTGQESQRQVRARRATNTTTNIPAAHHHPATRPSLDRTTEPAHPDFFRRK